MARNDETRVGGFPRLFQVDPSWYERDWLQEPAPRKPGTFAFLRRIISQLQLTRRQDAWAERLQHTGHGRRIGRSLATAFEVRRDGLDGSSVAELSDLASHRVVRSKVTT